MAILMLQDIPIYDIEKNTVLNKIFCPFPVRSDSKKAYEIWRNHRVYLKTNRASEQVVQQTGGMYTREAKRRLSLSDGYWIKYSYDKDTMFENITPYLNYFYEAYAVRSTVASSVPELVLGGSQPKVWARSKDGMTYMRKVLLPEQVVSEMLAVKLIRRCGGKVMNAFILTEKGRVYADNYSASVKKQQPGLINIVNMTNMNRSMIQFDQMGIGVNGYDPVNVAECYKRAGVTDDTLSVALIQVIFDAITGNTDRRNNNSNWAVFMDNKSGRRTPSRLYDFNWAVHVVESHDIVDAVADNIKRIKEKLNEAVTSTEFICNVCKELGLRVWHSNAQRLLDKLI